MNKQDPIFSTLNSKLLQNYLYRTFFGQKPNQKRLKKLVIFLKSITEHETCTGSGFLSKKQTISKKEN